MFAKLRSFFKRKTKKFNITQYTKIFVTAITIFTMLVIAACIHRNTAKAYTLAIAAINDLWKIGGLYMTKSLLETALEKGSIGKKQTEVER